MVKPARVAIAAAVVRAEAPVAVVGLSSAVTLDEIWLLAQTLLTPMVVVTTPVQSPEAYCVVMNCVGVQPMTDLDVVLEVCSQMP